MPNALLEAMACGLPCIATRVSGSEDVISDGINGLLVEPEQPAEMARALQRIIEDVDMVQRLGREGRETVVRDYQLNHIVEQCLALYQYLCAKNEHAHHQWRTAEGVTLQATASKTRDDVYTFTLNGGKSER
jgi:glycosyltransferase involved in cell wall biosynthesis